MRIIPVAVAATLLILAGCASGDDAVATDVEDFFEGAPLEGGAASGGAPADELTSDEAPDRIELDVDGSPATSVPDTTVPPPTTIPKAAPDPPERPPPTEAVVGEAALATQLVGLGMSIPEAACTAALYFDAEVHPEEKNYLSCITLERLLSLGRDVTTSP